MLGHFDGALDLIHSLDPHPFIGIDNVQRRGSSTTGIRLVMHRRMDGMHLHIVVAKPAFQLAHVLPAGVIKMLSRGE